MPAAVLQATAVPPVAVHPRYRLVRPCMLFLSTCGLQAFLFGGGLVQAGQLVYVWPVTGVLLALLLRSRQGRIGQRVEVGSVSAGTLVSGLVLHAPLVGILMVSLVQGFELSLLRWALRGHVAGFDDLKTRARVLRFFLAACGIPAVAALAAPLFLRSADSSLQAWAGVALSDSLGIAVFTPAVLFLLSGKLWSKDQAFDRFQAGIAASVLFLGVTAAIFSQNENPILFMAFPPLVVLVFVLGVRGAIFGSVAATVIACWATAYGHGPLWIAHGIAMSHRVLMLQVFLWSVVATSLPVGSLLDERRVAEYQARKNQMIYQTLIENSEDMIILSRLDASSRFVSPAVERMTGWTQTEFLARRSVELVHPEDRDLAGEILNSLARGKQNHRCRYRLLQKDGGFRWVEAHVRGFSDDESEGIKGYVATVRDISVSRQAEECLTAEKRAWRRRTRAWPSWQALMS